MRYLLPAFCIAASIFAPALARATPITETFTIAASGYLVFANASYTITYDPALNYANQTTGLVTNYQSNSEEGYGGPPSFTYTSPGQFTVGGGVAGVYGCDCYTYTFYFDAQTNASYFGSFVATNDTPRHGYAGTSYGTLTVVPVASSTVTPEPSSLLLLGTGMLSGVFAIRRRRMASAPALASTIPN